METNSLVLSWMQKELGRSFNPWEVNCHLFPLSLNKDNYRNRFQKTITLAMRNLSFRWDLVFLHRIWGHVLNWPCPLVLTSLMVVGRTRCQVQEQGGFYCPRFINNSPIKNKLYTKWLNCVLLRNLFSWGERKTLCLLWRWGCVLRISRLLHMLIWSSQERAKELGVSHITYMKP